MKQIDTMSLFTAVKTAAAGSEIKLSDHEIDKVAKRREDLEIVITGRYVNAYSSLVRYVRRHDNPMCDASDRAYYQSQIDFYNSELSLYEHILSICGYYNDCGIMSDLRGKAVEAADKNP